MSNEIKARPIAGNRYRVVNGDRLDNIEKAAYGSVKGVIEGANPQLANRVISLEDRPTIYQGDILNIPVLPELRTLKTDQIKNRLSGKDKNSLTIIIDNREVLYTSARAIRTMNTVADACSFRIAWTPGKDKKLDALLLPNSYPDAQVFIGNELIISGALYSVAPDVSKEGITVQCEVFSYTADLIDSTMPKPYEANKITLKARADQLLQPFGIKSVFESGIGDLKRFDRVTADRQDKVFNHIASLAAQRGLLLSSTPTGDLLFTKAKTGQKPVGTIESGGMYPLSWGAKFDGRANFNSITAFGESPGNSNKSATVVDDNIPRSRFISFKADETTDGDIETAANWRRSKNNAASLTIPFPVFGWYAPDSTLWKENTLVTIKSPEIFCPNGFTFLIEQVEYIVEKSGLTTTLSIVPPTVYTGDRLILPWEVV